MGKAALKCGSFCSVRARATRLLRGRDLLHVDAVLAEAFEVRGQRLRGAGVMRGGGRRRLDLDDPPPPHPARPNAAIPAMNTTSILRISYRGSHGNGHEQAPPDTLVDVAPVVLNAHTPRGRLPAALPPASLRLERPPARARDAPSGATDAPSRPHKHEWSSAMYAFRVGSSPISSWASSSSLRSARLAPARCRRPVPSTGNPR